MKKNIYTFKKGAYLYIEGDEDADDVFIVESGKIHFSSNNENIKPMPLHAGPGDIFGFVSALSRRPRMETALAGDDTRLLVLSAEEFLTRLQKNSSLALKILNYFAEFLRRYDNLMFPGNSREDHLPPQTRLYNTGTYYFEKSEYPISLYILNRLLALFPSFEHAEQARRMILDMETAGTRTVLEPFREGIYYSYSDHQIIFCEDEPGEELYIIKEGKIKIVKYQEKRELMLSVLKEGDIFGEMAIVSDKPRNATAISYGRTVLLPINSQALVRLIEQSPQILKRIYTSISQRLWFTHIRIDSRLYRQPVTRLYAFLSNKLLEDNISWRSEKPHTFKFGIDELLKMTGLSSGKHQPSIDELLKDANLEFNFGQIFVKKPKSLAARSQYFRSRDDIFSDNDESLSQGDTEKENVGTEVSSINIPSESETILTELDNLDGI